MSLTRGRIYSLQKKQDGLLGKSKHLILNAILYWLNTWIPYRNPMVHGRGTKEGIYNGETGHSRGGLTTKIHMVTDGLAPLRFLLCGGNRNDICMAQTLLESYDLKGKLILADKWYSSDKSVK